MLDIIKKTAAPLISLFIFTIGNGLFMTLIALRLEVAHAPSIIIGGMTAAYFIGLMLGSFRIERFIIRVGHIRAFASFSSALAVICILHGIFVNTWFWFGLRLVGGFATAGLLIVIESWLLIAGTVRTRGQVLALYMVTYYAALALGQFLINLADPKNLLLYTIAAMAASLAVIPLSITRSHSPEFGEPSRLSFRKLYQASPTGVLGAVCGGLILSAIYGLMPIYFIKLTAKTKDVAFLMALIIFGGMSLQYPLGKLSDIVDRRMVLIIVSLGTVVTCITTMLLSINPLFLAISVFMFGGLAFTIYPISISHTCDVLESNDIVAGTQGLVLAYSLGACFGPIIAAVFMHHLHDQGLFIFFIIICLFLSVFFLWRKFRQAPVTNEEQEQFVSIPQTTPVAAELDPRGDD